MPGKEMLIVSLVSIVFQPSSPFSVVLFWFNSVNIHVQSAVSYVT